MALWPLYWNDLEFTQDSLINICSHNCSHFKVLLCDFTIWILAWFSRDTEICCPEHKYICKGLMYSKVFFVFWRLNALAWLLLVQAFLYLSESSRQLPLRCFLNTQACTFKVRTDTAEDVERLRWSEMYKIKEFRFPVRLRDVRVFEKL